MAVPRFRSYPIAAMLADEAAAISAQPYCGEFGCGNLTNLRAIKCGRKLKVYCAHHVKQHLAAEDARQ